MRHCLLLDLKDDQALIDEYIRHHEAVWPEVVQNLQESGVTSMEIYHLGTRLCMVMETNDEIYNGAEMARRVEANPRLRAWESLMWRFQQPTPWTKNGDKWTAMTRVFDFKADRHSA